MTEQRRAELDQSAKAHLAILADLVATSETTALTCEVPATSLRYVLYRLEERCAGCGVLDAVRSQAETIGHLHERLDQINGLSRG